MEAGMVEVLQSKNILHRVTFAFLAESDQGGYLTTFAPDAERVYLRKV